MAIGTGISGGQKADLSVFEAICDSEEEAQDAEWEHNSQVALNRAGRR